MACYEDDVSNIYSGTSIPLDVDDVSCRRLSEEQPAEGMAVVYRDSSSEGPDIFVCWPGQIGTSIANLSDPSTPWTRLESCITAVRDDVAVNFASYGGNGDVVWRGLAMIQGETDAIDGNTNYTSQVLTFVDGVQTLASTELGQTSNVQITWDQPTNTPTNYGGRHIVDSQLLAALNQRSFARVITSKGHTTPTFPCPETDQAHSFEYLGSSGVHWSPCSERWGGYMHGKWLYRFIYGTSPIANDGGLQIASATWVSGSSTLEVCYNVAYPPLVRDTTYCPDHWMANDGFEVVNADGPLHTDRTLIGSPVVSSATLDGNCIDLVLDRAPSATFGRVEVSNRRQPTSNARCTLSGEWTGVLCPLGTECDGGAGEVCTPASEPENGCRDFPNTLGNGANTVNIGAPFVKYRDSDPASPPVSGAGPLYNWMLMQSYGGIVNGTAAPVADSPQYIEIGDNNEWVFFPDETPDALASAQFTFSVWIDTNGAGDGNLIRRGANGTTFFRIFFNNSAGVGSRLDLNLVSAGITGNATSFIMPENTADFVNYIITYDGSLPSQERVRHIYQCEDLPDAESASLPAAGIPDAVGNLNFGFPSGSPLVRYRDVAIWTSVLTDQQLFEQVCQAATDVTNATPTLPTPAYFVRPSCGDDITTANGITNLGSASNGTGSNHEAGDIVDPGSTCP